MSSKRYSGLGRCRKVVFQDSPSSSQQRNALNYTVFGNGRGSEKSLIRATNAAAMKQSLRAALKKPFLS